MWPVSSGYEGISDDDLADVLTINIKASEKDRHRASDDPAPAHGYERLAILRGGTLIMSERVIAEAPTSAGMRTAPGSVDAMDADELSEQIARIIQEAHIRRASDPAEAMAILRRLRLEIAGINASTREMAIIIDNALAGAMRQARNPAGASTVYVNCLDACHIMFGADARMSFIVADNLAGALLEVGDPEASSHIRRRLVQRLAQAFGREDMTTLRVIHNLAQTEFALGRYAETIKLLEQVVASDKSALGTSEVEAVQSLLAAARARLR